GAAGDVGGTTRCGSERGGAETQAATERTPTSPATLRQILRGSRRYKPANRLMRLRMTRRRDERPVRIARACVAREGPDLGHLMRGLRIAFDQGAGRIVSSEHDFALEGDRDFGVLSFHLRICDTRGLEGEECKVDALFLGFPGANFPIERLE